MSEAQAIKLGDGTLLVGIAKAILSVIDTEQFRQPAKDLALNAFDSIVVPHNFPNVPDFLEPRIKDAVRSAISPLIDKAFDAIKGADGATKVADAAKGAFDFIKAHKA